MESEHLLLTVPEAAERLAVSPNHLRRFIALGDLEVVRLGRSVRVPAHALATFIEKHTDASAVAS